jgi:hypothetical protein
MDSLIVGVFSCEVRSSLLPNASDRLYVSKVRVRKIALSSRGGSQSRISLGASSVDANRAASPTSTQAKEHQMRHWIHTCGLVVTIAITAFAVSFAQLPDIAETGEDISGLVSNTRNNFPTQISVEPQAAPAARPWEDQTVAPPEPVSTSVMDRQVFIDRSMSREPARPGFGYLHSFGAFQFYRNGAAEGMFMLRSKLPFPDNRDSIDFYHAPLIFVRNVEHTSFRTPAVMFRAEIGAPFNDTIYFVFGTQNVGSSEDDNGIRWVLYYNSQGRLLHSTRARFYRP